MGLECLRGWILKAGERSFWKDAVVVAADGLAVDQAGPHIEPAHRIEDQRVARRPVVAVAGEQADADGVAPRHQAEAVVLDLVNQAETSSAVARQVMEGRAR